jgi:septal ring factor EnvC (AmiA/AmiB activator)
MNPDIPTLVAQLKSRLAALGDGRDCRSDNERAAHYATTTSIARCITGLRNLPDDLARANTRLTDVASRRALVAAKQTELEQQLGDCPAHDIERQQRLALQLQWLREGRLLVAPDVFLESPDYLDSRIAELTRKRNSAQWALDAALRETDALLGHVIEVDGECSDTITVDGSHVDTITVDGARH